MKHDYPIVSRPDEAPPQAQALVKLRLAKCWIWFDNDGIPVLDEISFIDGVLLSVCTFFDWLLQSEGFPLKVIEIYDENFLQEFEEFSRYQGVN